MKDLVHFCTSIAHQINIYCGFNERRHVGRTIRDALLLKPQQIFMDALTNAQKLGRDGTDVLIEGAPSESHAPVKK